MMVKKGRMTRAQADAKIASAKARRDEMVARYSK